MPKTPMLLENNLTYRSAYRGYLAAANNRSKAAAKYFSKASESGLSNPAETKLIMSAANRDFCKDIKANNDIVTYIMGKVNIMKNILLLPFNKQYRQSANALSKAYKEAYPNTYLTRTRLISDGRVSLNSTMDTKERLEAMKINPDLNI